MEYEGFNIIIGDLTEIIEELLKKYVQRTVSLIGEFESDGRAYEKLQKEIDDYVKRVAFAGGGDIIKPTFERV